MENDLAPPRPDLAPARSRMSDLTSPLAPVSRRGEGEVRNRGAETGQFWLQFAGEVEPVDNFPRLSEVASPDRCRRCQSMIWKVIARSGFTYRLDPEPIDAKTDVVCYLAQRATFKLWPIGGGNFEVDRRTRNDLLWDKGERIVLAEHICDPDNIRTELPDYWPTKTYTMNEEPPF